MILGLFREGDCVRVRYGRRATFAMTRGRYERSDFDPPYQRLPTREEYETMPQNADEKPPLDTSAGEYMIEFYLGTLRPRSGSEDRRRNQPE